LRSRDSFISFSLKILFFIIPSTIMGYTIDYFTQFIQIKKYLGIQIIHYLSVQLFLIILILYGLIQMYPKYSTEFQNTTSGSFFIVLFFGVQTNFFVNVRNIFYKNLS
jgi:hypothetical protein